MRLRDAQAADAEAIARIYNQAVLHTTATFDESTKTAEDRREWLAAHGPTHPVVVATDDDGSVTGWASLSPWSDRCSYATTAEISIYVDEAYRGRGIGSALGLELLERARALGLRSILSRICTENGASLAMTEGRLGFTRVGVMHDVGRKFGRWLDVAVLERVLRG